MPPYNRSCEFPVILESKNKTKCFYALLISSFFFHLVTYISNSVDAHGARKNLFVHKLNKDETDRVCGEIVQFATKRSKQKTHLRTGQIQYSVC